MVIRCHIALDRQSSLIFIQKHLYQYIIRLVSIKNELQVGSHRGNLIIPPLRSNLLRILNLLAISIQIQQTGKRSNHCIVSISQGSTRMRKSDATICLLDDIPQEIALGEWLHIARIRRVAVSHLPPDVGIQPVLIQFLLRKEVIERNLASQFRALD